MLQGLLLAAVLLVPANAAAQGELAIIDFQDLPVRIATPAGESRPLQLVREPGAKAPGTLWGVTLHPGSGFGGRSFARFHWWDWSTSRAGHESEQAGWTAAGKWFRPSAGWPAFGPYFVRFRMRVNAPLLPHGSNGRCDGDTQMKFFIWNSFTGTGVDRAIMMLHAGSEDGRDDATHTTLDLRAGVSGSYARAAIRNRQWVHVQLGWQWGPEGAAFQRIWIDSNTQSSPTAENRRFTDLPGRVWGSLGGATALDDQFFLGNIANQGSCVRADAEIDLMDFEIATEFDPKWYTRP